MQEFLKDFVKLFINLINMHIIYVKSRPEEMNRVHKITATLLIIKLMLKWAVLVYNHCFEFMFKKPRHYVHLSWECI